MEWIEPKNRTMLYKLFNGMNDTLILSCTQGLLGSACADDTLHPTAAVLFVGEFGFLAGDASSPDAQALCKVLPEGYASDVALMIPQNAQWEALLETVHGKRMERIKRYAFAKDTHFDVYRLLSLRSNLPKPYTIVPLDKAWFSWCQERSWSCDFVAQYKNAEDYQKNGIGSLVLLNGEPVCGASSYSYYHGGIEIEIDTVDEHRKKGFATACAADLILRCLERGLYPSWDAANMTSVRLAQRLGYSQPIEYTTCEISVGEEQA